MHSPQTRCPLQYLGSLLIVSSFSRIGMQWRTGGIGSVLMEEVGCIESWGEDPMSRESSGDDRDSPESSGEDTKSPEGEFGLVVMSDDSEGGEGGLIGIFISGGVCAWAMVWTCASG